MSIQIKKIKVGDMVVGMNKGGEIVPTRVLKVFHNGTAQKWVKLTFSRSGLAGPSSQKTTCTPCHKFWVHSEQRYVEARNLEVGQPISMLKSTLILTDFQKQVLLGLSVGDGYYSKRGQSGKVAYSHKKEHIDLVKYTNGVLGNIAKSVLNEYTSGYGTQIIRDSTKELLSIKNI